MKQAPYLYTPSINNGSTFEFNPRAYTQASYASSLEQQSPKPKREGPLIDLNKHPDSWMVVTTHASSVEPMPANTRTLVLTFRGIQLAFRILQLIAAVGLFICIICLRSVKDVQGWLMRIPPGYDIFLCLYAIYHLCRPAHARPAASSASYHFFALCMDGGLIPFYVYTAMFSFSNYNQVPGTEGRWTTSFDNDDATSKILWAIFLTSSTIGGLHALSTILDILLILWFRRISNMPPDLNPLDISPRVSKHKHKSSEISTSSLLSEKKSYAGQSNESFPTNISSPQQRQVPFSHTRMDSDSSFVPHTLESARAARMGSPVRPGSFYAQSPSARGSQIGSSPGRPNSFYAQAPSVRSSRTSVPALPRYMTNNANDVHSPFAGHAFPFPPGQDRASFVASRPNSADHRAHAPSAGPQAALDQREARRMQSESLLSREKDTERENWYVFDENSDLGSPVKGSKAGQEFAARGPAVPPKQHQQHQMTKKKGATAGSACDSVDTRNKENLSLVGVRRQLTVCSSVYSHDDDDSIISAGTAKVHRYYGDLSEEGRHEVQAVHGYGDRNVSSSGVELRDDGPVDVRGRNVSGKGAEEGRAGRW